MFIALEAWNDLCCGMSALGFRNNALSGYWLKLNMHLSTCALQFLPCFLQNGKWKLELENGKWNVRSGLPAVHTACMVQTVCACSISPTFIEFDWPASHFRFRYARSSQTTVDVQQAFLN